MDSSSSAAGRHAGLGDCSPEPCVVDALRRLDVRRLLLGIHDASFPSDASEDTGSGSPYGRGGEALLAFVRALGFDGIQLGPQGAPQPDDPSPYRSAAFPRSPLSIALLPLAEDERWGGLLPHEVLDAIARALPAGGAERLPYAHARRVQQRALEACYGGHRARLRDAGDAAVRAAAAALEERRARFETEQGDWLERYECFELLANIHGTRDWRRWSAGADAALDARLFGPRPGEEAACSARQHQLRASFGEAVSFYRFVQLLAHEQHAQLHAKARGAGLALFGDLSIGLSNEDEWCFRHLVLSDYRMGAPPSRTNPEGQPWNFAVLDPSQYGSGARPGPVLRFVQRRAEAFFAAYDGLRIDHPHGLVCPWVYRADDADPLAAVQNGARLFSSPAEAGHAALARFAIAREDQIDQGAARHADDRVRELDREQVDRYGILLDAVVAPAKRDPLDADVVACEVLSTLPLPVARVLTRHGLGRFRVTQKASLTDLADPYRSETARPEDWVMVGTHDTPSLWQAVEDWKRSGAIADRAAHLASVLAPSEDEREPLARRLAGDPNLLAQACFAALFASPARHVAVFFTDLLGIRERYNRPGSISESNWTLRVPRDFAARYRERLRSHEALNLPLALAMALRARAAPGGASVREIVHALEELGDHWRGRVA